MRGAAGRALLALAAAAVGGMPAAATTVDDLLLDAVDREAPASWVRWSFRSVPMERNAVGIGCGWRHGRIVSGDPLRFDDERGGTTRITDAPEPAAGDGARSIHLFAGFRRGELAAIRTYDEACLPAIDARLVELGAIARADVAAWLVARAEDGRLAERSREHALIGTALIDAPGATGALERWARGDDDELAEQSIFWLGEARGTPGLDALDRLLASDLGAGRRRQLAFAFSLGGTARGDRQLVRLARRDPSAEVRSQALFWMAQRAADSLPGEIERAIDDDPEQAVKEQAVFALSRLPDDEGVPLLIRLARQHRNPGVRRAAMFWLGQSGSDEALAFFEAALD